MKINDVVRVNSPEHPLHDVVGIIDAQFGGGRWRVDFTPEYGNIATFPESQLILVKASHANS